MLTERARALGFHGSGYHLIYADPPWQYRDKALAGNRGAGCKYPVMSWRDIAALPIADICAPDCVLAMWHVPPQPAEALEVCKAWGFKFKTMKLFTWIKRSPAGVLAWGQGHYSRGNSEDVLFGVGEAIADEWAAEDCLVALRGHYWRASASVHQVIEAPRREHSRKPDEVADRLVQLFGPVKRLELFARHRRDPSWDYWGNEL
jgi:N6-adenosine-specific RNA methylase IME4